MVARKHSQSFQNPQNLRVFSFVNDSQCMVYRSKRLMIRSYYMPICIGIDIGISIGKIFSSVLGIEVSEKSGISPPLVYSTNIQPLS